LRLKKGFFFLSRSGLSGGLFIFSPLSSILLVPGETRSQG
jgi:hypothetical protein